MMRRGREWPDTPQCSLLVCRGRRGMGGGIRVDGGRG